MTTELNPPAADRLAQTVTEELLRLVRFRMEHAMYIGYTEIAALADALEAALRARESAPAQEPSILAKPGDHHGQSTLTGPSVKP